jgi:hypothetical protein
LVVAFTLNWSQHKYGAAFTQTLLKKEQTADAHS